MHLFQYRNNELYAEDVPVRKLAEEFGTPLYIYSYNTLLSHFKAYEDAFDSLPHIVCFALKANSNAAIARLLAKKGGGADVVSGGELFRALKSGIPAKKIVYAGVGKTGEEIRYALKSGILMFNVESEDELREIDRIAGTMRIKAPIALRINPDIDPQTHPYISTGLKKHKFGIPIEDALQYYRLANSLKNIKIAGIHKHIGSQLTKVSPFVDALKRILLLVDELERRGIRIDYLDIGGGLGITYRDETPPDPAQLAKNILPLLKGRKLTIVLEPGRSIVGNAGILVTKTLYLKKGHEKEFVIVDAGMNDLIRPSIYDAYHHIQPVIKNRRNKVIADIVGPICESGDFLAKDREIPGVKNGEYLAVMSAGAYGFTMSSNYNSRPKAAEVMVKGKKYALIRKRETYNDIIKGETIPEFV
ncbi:MAG TPA: diaminopimelate decarboxylase [Nitrospiraceae bacterium]|nr:MAG: diaminopimelate decarboxylase [Nitrospirae bacterium GWA2_46_11]OGW23418.1 MAG: diaminopimelate decarboxylase [Nitrospirae bacterium GWB2_47_37]HAK89843.1 diaminopimelate decarboxylase [Nitrospiraceae bacterium]HCL81754.1 diaminopimelate decarboxylase [Nitrospiraceae bacterium]HCZ10982.1 diaminopimelate decarboxylase [Nitrospiraceae bacterium]